jgi:hypothetical protein
VIPTVLLAAFLIGRWWAVPGLALVWVLLVVGTADAAVTAIPVAATLAGANALAGWLMRSGLAGALGLVRVHRTTRTR